MKTNTQRIWTRAELTIAYYIAKFGIESLKISAKDLAEAVIEDTTERSLDMQVANFRFILGIDGYQLEHFSAAQDDVATALQDKTITQVRKIVDFLIGVSDLKLEKLASRRNNVKVNDVKDKLNQESQTRFEAKLRAIGKYRNLRKL